MTREELKKQAALQYRKHTEEYGDTIVTSTERQLAFEAGWDAADENPKNPWRDAEKDPPKDMKPVIGYADGRIGQYEYSPEEKIWSFGIFLSDAPDYWMPIPELRGGEK